MRRRRLRASATKRPWTRNTAALLEHAGDGLYTLGLGNLLAGETAVIRYRYAELLDRHEDHIRFCVPTVIAPRYGDA